MALGLNLSPSLGFPVSVLRSLVSDTNIWGGVPESQNRTPTVPRREPGYLELCQSLRVGNPACPLSYHDIPRNPYTQSHLVTHHRRLHFNSAPWAPPPIARRLNLPFSYAAIFTRQWIPRHPHRAVLKNFSLCGSLEPSNRNTPAPQKENVLFGAVHTPECENLHGLMRPPLHSGAIMDKNSRLSQGLI